MVINPSHFVSQNVLTVDSLYALLVCSVVLFLKDMSYLDRKHGFLTAVSQLKAHDLPNNTVWNFED